MEYLSVGSIRSTAKAIIWTGILVFALNLTIVPTYCDESNTGSAAAVVASVSAPESVKDKNAALSEIAAKLANPVSDVWALFTEYDIYFNDGNVNRGDAKVGGRMIFEPIMPIPLYGTGNNEWKLITRPSVPVFFSHPIPNGFDNFNQRGGLGDTQLPMLFSPSVENFIFGLGPCWLLPTATDTSLGQQQWGVGPSAVFGYKTKEWLAVTIPQYYFGIGSIGGSDGSTPDASYLNMFYALIFNLPNAWQVGCNPTITYDNRASSGNQWNAPVGFFVAKTIRIGGVPMKLQLGFDYSVVSQDDFGQKYQIKLNVVPVIPALINNPIFGSD
jgi:hypothetical protein